MNTNSAKTLGQHLLVWISVTLLFVTLSGCSSSSSSGPDSVTVNGVVQAPAGQLAAAPKTMLQRLASLSPIAKVLAIDVSGWTAVPNATLRVFTIDNDGEPVGSVIATATTSASGEYSLTLPAGTTLASNLIVQASSDPSITGPVPIGTADTLSAPLVSDAVDVNPVTEAATRALVARTEPLANFSAAEVTDYIAAIEALVEDAALPPYADLAAAIDGIATSFATEITEALDDISDPPPAPPGNLTGTWISSYNCETTPPGDGFSGTDIINITQTGNAISFTAAEDLGPGATPVFNMNGTGTLNGNVVTWSLTGVGFTETGTWEVSNDTTMIKQSTYTNTQGGGGGTCSGSIHKET